MVWKKESRIPTNLIVGFLGSGKTTAIGKLIRRRPVGQKWSIFINEYGMVSIDQAIVDTGTSDLAVEELGGGCACCTMSYAFQPLLAQFIRRSKPDRLIVEPSGASHPANVIDVLRRDNFLSVIDLRNTICLIDPSDFENERKRETAVFHDQIQVADIVIINWTDKRDRSVIDRCRHWIESFAPPKLMILESSFGEIDPSCLDVDASSLRSASFPDAHAKPVTILGDIPVLNAGYTSDGNSTPANHAKPGAPLRLANNDQENDACGWVFHVDDIFKRERIFELLESIHPIARLKGIFRCEDGWWSINRAKDSTSRSASAHRRDSRLEIILDQPSISWQELEHRLLECLLT
ncbi:MAG: GTP-binding protein [Pirellula sp.]|jgi:G3E family GTPase|nr:GTP-binding protein [Pirellula sp.]